MDCERNAVRRFLKKLRQDHPHLQFVVNEDALSSNAPHIDDLEANNLHYILGVKEGDHKFVFQYIEDAVARGDVTELNITKQDEPDLIHCFRVVYNVPLNKSKQDKRVTFVEYWEENSNSGKVQHFTWITDLTITKEKMFDFMRGARARWKIENEVFNTLKNHGYHFGHNFVLGKKHLSEALVLLMILAFLIDQILQICCLLFQAACKKSVTKRSFLGKGTREISMHFKSRQWRICIVPCWCITRFRCNTDARIVLMSKISSLLEKYRQGKMAWCVKKTPKFGRFSPDHHIGGQQTTIYCLVL